MGPSSTPPPLSFGYRCCSCGSISHCNPGLMISPSSRLCLELLPCPSVPDIHSAPHHSPPATRPTQQRSDTGIIVTNISVTSITITNISGTNISGTSISDTDITSLPAPCCWSWQGPGLHCSGPTNPASIPGGRGTSAALVAQGRHLATSPHACSCKEGQVWGTEGVIRASICPRISDYFSVSWWILLASII